MVEREPVWCATGTGHRLDTVHRSGEHETKKSKGKMRENKLTEQSVLVLVLVLAQEQEQQVQQQEQQEEEP